MPSYIVYEQYSSNGSRSPNDVSESQDGNFRFVTFKVSKFKIKQITSYFYQLKHETVAPTNMGSNDVAFGIFGEVFKETSLANTE